MTGYVASALLLNINRYQAVPAILSCLCYRAAFIRSLKVPALRSLMGNEDSTTLVTWKVFLGFTVGLLAWRIWIWLSKWMIRGELALREQADTVRGKLLLLGLRAPALTFFPVAGAYISKYFIGEDGTYIMTALALSVFLIQLTFPYENDFGSVDTFEGVHLPILPQIDRPFFDVLGFSLLYYSRKFLVLLADETVKRRQRRRRRRRPRRRRQNQRLTEVQQQGFTWSSRATTGIRYFRLLANESKAFVTVAQTEEFQRALTFPDENIDGDTLIEYTERLNSLSYYADKAEEYLNSFPEEV